MELRSVEDVYRAFFNEDPPQQTSQPRERDPGNSTVDLARIRRACKTLKSKPGEQPGTLWLDDRYNWLQLMFALKDVEQQSGEDMRQLFHDTSQASSKYDEQDAGRVWDSCKYRPGGTTTASLFHWVAESRPPLVIRHGPRSEAAAAASKHVATAGCEWVPIPASRIEELANMPGPVSWIHDGWLARGFCTILSAHPKVGKTLLASHILRGMTCGDVDIGGTIRKATCLVVTEEGPQHWTRRRDALGIGDNIRFIFRPFDAKPSYKRWTRFIEAVERILLNDPLDCVMLDTFSHVSPVRDENSSAEVTAALTPLNRLLKAGAGLLLCHHSNKSDHSEGRSLRGSSALAGFADVIAELRRYNPHDVADRRRKLAGSGRFDETPSEVVIELGPHGYTTAGSVADVTCEDRLQEVLQLLEEQSPLTVVELRDAWPGDRPPSRRMLQKVIDRGEKKRVLVREGTGRRGDAFRYSLPQPAFVSAPIDT